MTVTSEVETPPASSSGRDLARLLGCEIDRLDMDATVARCAELIEAGEPVQHVAVNVAKIVALRDDPRLAAIVAGCALVSADGQPLVWASRLLRDPLPERVAGIDLMHRLLALAEERGYRVFVLGAREDVLGAAVARLRELHPRLELAGWHHGWFTDAEDEQVCEEIRAAAPHVLLVAMSSPRKEEWLSRHAARLGVPFSMGVGGSIDVVAGVTRRAPRWMQRAGLEWLYRLLQEPLRLGPRYLRTNGRFAALLARELLSRRR
jgi:N-acetylglucosaminyldiphosphoundecaprenol N-acetyl-beta-D-mannosaminyltransferase